jgi:hypothetical protein
MFALIDNRDDAIRSECEEIVSHLAKDSFGQTILEMHAAMRMDEVFRVVVAEERRKAETFHVQVSVREKTGATGAERGTNAFAALFVGVESEKLVTVKLVAVYGAMCKRGEKLLI